MLLLLALAGDSFGFACIDALSELDDAKVCRKALLREYLLLERFISLVDESEGFYIRMDGGSRIVQYDPLAMKLYLVVVFVTVAAVVIAATVLLVPAERWWSTMP